MGTRSAEKVPLSCFPGRAVRPAGVRRGRARVGQIQVGQRRLRQGRQVHRGDDLFYLRIRSISQPGLKLGHIRVNPAAWSARDPMHRQLAFRFPAPHGAYVPFEKSCDLFPRAQPARQRRDLSVQAWRPERLFGIGVRLIPLPVRPVFWPCPQMSLNARSCRLVEVSRRTIIGRSPALTKSNRHNEARMVAGREPLRVSLPHYPFAS